MVILKNEASIELIEKKSRFIGYIKPVKSQKEARDFIEKISKENMQATHNVFVYRLIENDKEYFKYDDDGEPLNTAAKPMAEIFERKKVYNFALVCTRYFGGIKLGAGGLIRAYAKVASNIYIKCEFCEYVKKSEYLLSFSYDKKDYIEKIIAKNSIEVLEKSFLEKVYLKLELSDENLKEFNKIYDIDLIKIKE